MCHSYFHHEPIYAVPYDTYPAQRHSQVAFGPSQFSGAASRASLVSAYSDDSYPGDRLEKIT